jgi:trimethylamine-N-oxide reductase (cytochrome c)
LGLFAHPLLLNRAAFAKMASGEVFSASHWGAFRAQVKDGRWVSIRPWEKDPRPTHQLAGVRDSVYSPTRIRYPMVRRAFLEKGAGADVETRGSGDFVRVSWDKALDLVAGELKRVGKTYGAAGTFAGSYGWKSTGKLHNCQNLMRRMMNVTKHGFVNASGDYSTGASQIVMPHVMGTLEVYEQQTAWPVVIENTETLVFGGGRSHQDLPDRLAGARPHRLRQPCGLQEDRKEGHQYRSGAHRHGEVLWCRMGAHPSPHGSAHDARHGLHSLHRETARRQIPR